VPGCKRHAGKGFTRKENLDEHLRRVHGFTTTSDASQLQQIAVDTAPSAEMMETLASRMPDTADIDDSTTATTACPDLANNKRRRLDTGTSPRNGPDDLKLELQRLKADNLEKDERIRRMQENEAAITARRESLEEKLAQLTPQTLQQRIPEQADMGTYPYVKESTAEVAMQQVHWPRPRQSISNPRRSEPFSEYDERDQAGTHQHRKRRHSEELPSKTAMAPPSQHSRLHRKIHRSCDGYSYGFERSKGASSVNDDDDNDKMLGDMTLIDALFGRWIQDADAL
jgi:hypothetical protein